jgi:hypothetical protein
MWFIIAIGLAMSFRISRNVTFFVLGRTFLVVLVTSTLLFKLKASYISILIVVVSSNCLTFLTISTSLLVTSSTSACFYYLALSPFVIVYLLSIVAHFFIILEEFYHFSIISLFLLTAALSILALTSLSLKSSWSDSNSPNLTKIEETSALSSTS